MFTFLYLSMLKFRDISSGTARSNLLQNIVNTLDVVIIKGVAVVKSV